MEIKREMMNKIKDDERNEEGIKIIKINNKTIKFKKQKGKIKLK